VALRDGAELVGLAPLCVSRDRWGLVTGHVLGHNTSSYSEPLAAEGRQSELAAAIASCLSAPADPVDVLSLAAIPHDSPWPSLIQNAWPGHRPRISLVSTMQAPYAELSPGGFDAWLGGRSSHFRRHARRGRRQFLQRGGRFTRARSAAEMVDGIKALERLHLGRWSTRGGSQAIVSGVVDMLMQGGDLLGPDRMQVWTADVDGGAVAVALFVSAGQEMHLWLTGFDEEWAALSPSILLLIEAISDGAETGFRRVSFGPGAQPYKYRLATGEERLDWIDLLPVTPRYPYVRLVQSPQWLHRMAARRTPPVVKQRLRSMAGRVPTRRRSTAGTNED